MDYIRFLDKNKITYLSSGWIGSELCRIKLTTINFMNLQMKMPMPIRFFR